ncbi:MAG: hypothetical protein IKE70_05910, partial [Bacilli bacterium]|nr:hypothetical protein [Bacilli bacterium]
MFSEYVFENAKYGMAAKNVKATLFDIVANENAKLISVIKESKSPIYSDMKDEIDRICSYQDACLRKLVSSTHQLISILQDLDSYSKKLKSVQEKGMKELAERYYDSILQSEYNTSYNDEVNSQELDNNLQTSVDENNSYGDEIV